MLTLLAAVTKPLALTVNCPTWVAEPKVPTLLLTVAKAVTKDPAVVVTSPVRAGNLPAARVPLALEPDRSMGLAVICCPERVK